MKTPLYRMTSLIMETIKHCPICLLKDSFLTLFLRINTIWLLQPLYSSLTVRESLAVSCERILHVQFQCFSWVFTMIITGFIVQHGKGRTLKIGLHTTPTTTTTTQTFLWNLGSVGGLELVYLVLYILRFCLVELSSQIQFISLVW